MEEQSVVISTVLTRIIDISCHALNVFSELAKEAIMGISLIVRDTHVL